MVKRKDSRWAVILAAGDGARLAPLTAALYGYGLPKQFAVIDGRRSLLQGTVERVEQVATPQHIVVVVGESHEALARAQLSGHPGVTVIAQPRNIGTGPGVLLPLAGIMARDPEAEVAIFPSDHHIPHPKPFLAAVTEAFANVRIYPDLITLLGVVPDRAETDYGWILPGSRLRQSGSGGLRLVRRFVEKPSPQRAQWLLEHHALWNTFTLVGRLGTYWALARRHLPRHAWLFARYARTIGGAEEKMALASLYGNLPPVDFSRSVLGPAEGLATLSVGQSGWCDWGRPERVMRSLAGTTSLVRLQERLQSAGIGEHGTAWAGRST
jgi:mannose-1-phosphate guanylyltransferase